MATRGLEEAARLLDVEHATLEEDVGGVGQGCAGRQDLLDRVVHVGVGRGRFGRGGVEREACGRDPHAGDIAGRPGGREHAGLVLGGQPVA